jgi:hypothetical protein
MTYIFFEAAPSPVALATGSSDIVRGDAESTVGAGEEQSEIAGPATIASTTHADGYPASIPTVQSTLSPSTSAVAIATEDLPMGRFGRKRKVVQIHGLSDCECGLQADPNAEDVVQCKRDGCETRWVSHFNYSIDYILLICYLKYPVASRLYRT